MSNTHGTASHTSSHKGNSKDNKVDSKDDKTSKKPPSQLNNSKKIRQKWKEIIKLLYLREFF